MAKGDFVIVRARPETRKALEECARLAGATYTEVIRTALERYLADLRRARRRR